MPLKAALSSRTSLGMLSIARRVCRRAGEWVRVGGGWGSIVVGAGGPAGGGEGGGARGEGAKEGARGDAGGHGGRSVAGMGPGEGGGGGAFAGDNRKNTFLNLGNFL